VFGGFGVLIYAALWFLMPLAPDTVPAAPVCRAHAEWPAFRRAAATGGRGEAAEAGEEPRPAARVGGHRIGLCLLLQIAGFGIAGKLFWPLVFAATGLALIWRQADESQKDKWTATSASRSSGWCSARAAGSR